MSRRFYRLNAAHNRRRATAGTRLQSSCASQCHAVDRGVTGPILADVPSFAAIAARSQVTAEYLAARIIVPHPEMPGVPLTRQELRDIIAYIMDLK